MKEGIVSAVSNYKGGVGKTTVSIHLSAALAIKGKKVLLIDGDPQSDSTRALLPAGTQIKESLYEILTSDGNGDINPVNFIYKTVHQNLFIIPNISETSGLEIPMARKFPESNTILRNSVRDFAKKNFDFIFIDCPPTLSIFVNNNLYASDILIVPMDAGSGNSLEGIKGILDLMNAIQLDGFDLRFLKILVNRVDRRKGSHRANIQDAKMRFGKESVFKTSLPTSSIVQTNEAIGSSTIFTLSPNCKVAQSFRKIAIELMSYF